MSEVKLRKIGLHHVKQSECRKISIRRVDYELRDYLDKYLYSVALINGYIKRGENINMVVNALNKLDYDVFLSKYMKSTMLQNKYNGLEYIIIETVQKLCTILDEVIYKCGRQALKITVEKLNDVKIKTQYDAINGVKYQKVKNCSLIMYDNLVVNKIPEDKIIKPKFIPDNDHWLLLHIGDANYVRISKQVYKKLYDIVNLTVYVLIGEVSNATDSDLKEYRQAVEGELDPSDYDENIVEMFKYYRTNLRDPASIISVFRGLESALSVMSDPINEFIYQFIYDRVKIVHRDGTVELLGYYKFIIDYLYEVIS